MGVGDDPSTNEVRANAQTYSPAVILVFEQDLVSDRIIVFQNILNKFFWLKAESLGPFPVSIRGDAAATGFELRNECVVLNPHVISEATLRQARALAQTLQPPTALATQFLRVRDVTLLLIAIHNFAIPPLW